MYLTYRDRTNTEMGVDIKDLQVPPRAAEQYEMLKIPGMLSPVPRRLGQYNSSKLTAALVMRDCTDLRAVYAWLSGEGNLICSDTPELYYRVLACDIINTKRVGAANTVRELTVSFTVLPFAYATDNTPITATASPMEFYTQGTIYSEPLILLSGISGDVVLTVNTVELTITGITGDLYIDVERRKAYQVNDDGSKRIVLSNTVGKLWNMVLVSSESAQNIISWTGTVSSVTITKNERWL